MARALVARKSAQCHLVFPILGSLHLFEVLRPTIPARVRFAEDGDMSGGAGDKIAHPTTMVLLMSLYLANLSK